MTRYHLALVLAAALTATGVARAQEPAGPCSLEFENTPSTRLTSVRLAGGGYDSFLGGGVVAHCAGQNMMLRADSAEYYQERNVLYLIGQVHYTEPRATVDARRMTYFLSEERLLAEQDVRAVLPSGTTMNGPVAEYFRAVPGVRAVSRLVATGRPRMAVVEVDSLGRPQPPVDVVADRITTEGDSLVYAVGRVEISRHDFEARADSAFLDGGTEFARLMRSPSVVGREGRPFRLDGRVIDLYSERRQLERVVSAGSAHAVSEDLDLRSDTIDLRLAERQLQRAYAWGPSRARATSPDRTILADSLDVLMPRQRLRLVRALREAYAESVPDTSRVRSTERDWLRGDTISARFDTAAAPADTSRRPRIRELVADGDAQAFYQVAPRERGSDRPAINYVRGGRITVAFADQQVSSVTVIDSAAGVYLEPAADSAGADTVRADSATTPVAARSADAAPRDTPAPGVARAGSPDAGAPRADRAPAPAAPAPAPSAPAPSAATPSAASTPPAPAAPPAPVPPPRTPPPSAGGRA